MKRIAVILSGCGVYDGAEIHESVLTLLAIERQGASYQCFAPNIEQAHVVNHLSGEVVPGESRNVLVEAARIARGDICDLTELAVEDFDALILPGGYGVAKNLCDFAFQGTDCQVNPLVLERCQAFANAGKAAGYLCISPAMLPLIYGQGVEGTLGRDPGTADAFTTLGGTHQFCDVSEIVVDRQHKVVTSPAYMLASTISEAASGIDKLVAEVVEMA